MKVYDLLESRRGQWRELETLCARLEDPRGPRLRPDEIARFAALYRAACGDLALADAYQLPPGTIEYLHRLVGRAHNQLYRSRTFNFRAWGRVLLVDVPRRLCADRALWLAFALFWGIFGLSATLAYFDPGYAEGVLGKEQLAEIEDMYSESRLGRSAETGALMSGFYIFNNMGIGLRCFAFGLAFGVGGMYVTAVNARFIGAVYGHMARLPQWEHFSTFVTAHGPFELTAIVFCAAAGMRLGFSIVSTGGLTRGASLRAAARETMPTVGAALVLFGLAAAIEGFLSPSAAPYALKAAVAVVSTAILLAYVLVLGRPRRT